MHLQVKPSQVRKQETFLPLILYYYRFKGSSARYVFIKVTILIAKKLQDSFSIYSARVPKQNSLPFINSVICV